MTTANGPVMVVVAHPEQPRLIIDITDTMDLELEAVRCLARLLRRGTIGEEQSSVWRVR